MNHTKLIAGAVLALAALTTLAQPVPQEAAIRKGLAANMESLPKIDEISRTPLPGLFEVRLGTDIFYTDAEGSFAVRGEIFDLKSRRNLTEERIDKLTAIDFASLPLKDAVLIRQGSGARKVVVFSDPNCGYCKRLERDLLVLKDVSIYTFLYPILGPDSSARSKDIWCAKDPAKVWRAWMVDGQVPAKVSTSCDIAAIERNTEMGKKYKVQGTPAMVFEDGSRAPGAIPAAQIELRLAAAKKT